MKVLAATLALAAAVAHVHADTGTLNTTAPGAVIRKEVYGQFVEHLGRGVYEGIGSAPTHPSPTPAASAMT